MPIMFPCKQPLFAFSDLSIQQPDSVTSFLTCLLTDPERKILIDKLAMFVARNGHEFEKLTRNKQRHNPKFAFLFGGEHCDYYRYRVAVEKTGRLQEDIFLMSLKCGRTKKFQFYFGYSMITHPQKVLFYTKFPLLFMTF